MFNRLLLQKQIGLVYTDTEIRGAEISYQGKSISTIHLFQREKNAFSPSSLSPETTIVTGIPTQESLLRPLSLRLKKKKDVDAVLSFETEPLLPFPIEKALLDRIVRMQNAEGTTLSVIACLSDHLEQHLQRWQGISIEPERVTTTPAALASFASLFPFEGESRFVVYVGEEEIACILLHQDKLVAVFPIRESTQDKKILQLAIVKTLFALSKQHKEIEPTEILLCGEALFSIASIEEWSSLLPHPVSLPSPQEGWSLSQEDLLCYALPIGLACNGNEKDANRLNLRQREWSYPHPLRKSKKPLVLIGSFSLLLTIAFFLFGTAYLAHENGHIRKEYIELLHSMHYSHENFEKEYRSTRNLSTIDGDETIVSVRNLSQEELEDRLYYLDKQIQKQPFHFPLLPNVPLVGDVLAWYVNHPAVVHIDPETGERQTLLQLESFSYSLVKRPDLSKKGEKYQAKVDITFSTDVPKLARAFHDSLIEPNEVVDPKNEVKWNAQRGKYQATFFVKDKTVYTTGGKV